MRELDAQLVTSTVRRLALDAAFELGEAELQALRRARDEEEGRAERVLGIVLENAEIARGERLPICQDTGVAIVFAEVGEEVVIVGGVLCDAVNEGVRRAYTEGHLRASVVSDPFLRRNTGDNTPAVVHVSHVPGDRLRLCFCAKGAGSENMTRLVMLKPADGEKGVVEFVARAVVEGAPNACAPLVVGVGVGGTSELACLLAKRALLRPIGERHTQAHIARLEEQILDAVNSSGVGPQGLGGRTTALAVHIETHPCHIASLPVCVALDCHAHRHKEAVL